MKKIFLLFVSILVLSITASASDLMVQSGSGGKVIELTKSEFLKKVYDYEKNLFLDNYKILIYALQIY